MPVELKQRVDALAAEIGISSSAVWKILIHRSTRALLAGGTISADEMLKETFEENEADAKTREPPPVGITSEPPPWRRQRAT